MKIVIDIPEELYAAYKGRPPMLGDAGMDMIAQAIANGTPLPKGYGDLIDRDALIQKQFIPNVGFELVDLDDLKIAPTVIPADK